jgi:hypothetical protein
MNSAYVTADIVTRNQTSGNIAQLASGDVFDIPDITTIPVHIPVQVPPLQILKSPSALAPAPAPAPAPPSARSYTTTNGNTPLHAEQSNAVNFIKAINHSAMTDIMNQAIIRNSQNPQSITSKKSAVSVPIVANDLTKNQQQSQGQGVGSIVPVVSSPIRENAPTPPPALGTTQGQVQTTKPTHRNKPLTNSKIIIEDEDKDTAIDYDDDDPEIKKIKLSLFHFAKDITFNLIFIIPFLRTKLNNILREPSLAINQIERVFDEFKDRLNRLQLESLKKYVCEDGIRDKLNFILESGFNKILSDGKIDINDAPQFNQLVYFIIKSFNNINQGKVYRFYISSEHVMLLLHFILKSVFTLTLKGDEEQMAIGLLDTSFKLVQIEVQPLISKRWYHRFRICHAVKEIEELIE